MLTLTITSDIPISVTYSGGTIIPLWAPYTQHQPGPDYWLSQTVPTVPINECWSGTIDHFPNNDVTDSAVPREIYSIPLPGEQVQHEPRAEMVPSNPTTLPNIETGIVARNPKRARETKMKPEYIEINKIYRQISRKKRENRIQINEERKRIAEREGRKRNICNSVQLTHNVIVKEIQQKLARRETRGKH